MAESTFRNTSTFTIDGIAIDTANPLDGEVLVYDGTSFVADPIIPVGTVEMWAGLSSSIPSGWLLCDGGQYPIGSAGSIYYALSQVITTRYGAYTNGSGAAGSSHFVVPNITNTSLAWASRAPLPYGTTGSTSGATSLTINADVTHSHTLSNASATTNSDGTSSHSHTITSADGLHTHSLDAANWSHSHDSGTPGAHRHGIIVGNSASATTGFTAHTPSQHGVTNSDTAQAHSHTSGIENNFANSSSTHFHSIPTSSGLNHSHTWTTNATTTTANDSAHNHAINIVPICYIIKY